MNIRAALHARVAAVTGAAGLIFAVGIALGGGFVPVGEPRALKGAPGVYESRFEEVRGPSPFDRIALHRITAGPTNPVRPDAVLLFLPGTHMNGEVGSDDPRHNFAVYLATKEIDTWSLDYRTHFIPSQTSQSGLAELKGWTNELFESDIDAAVDLIRARSDATKLFVAGFSRGVEFAYLFAARHPDRCAGIVALDGFIDDRSMTTGSPSSYAEEVGGRRLTYDKRKFLLWLVIQDPNAPAPIPKYKTARENLEHVLYDSARFGGSGGLADALDGFSDGDTLARVLLPDDRWWPSIQDYEAGLTPELKKSLGSSRIPVLAFSSTNMSPRWPRMARDSAASTGSSDVTFKELKGWGHLDVLCGTKAQAEVYAPAAAWIMRHAK